MYYHTGHKALQNVTIVVLLVVPALALLGSLNSAFAITETVFEEDFDNGLSGWSESLCTVHRPSQTCIIGQRTELFDPPNELPNSLPNWGIVQVTDTGGSDLGPIAVRFAKTFNVADEDVYDVRAWIGLKDCQGCNISTQLFIDGILVIDKVGENIPSAVQTSPNHKFFEQSSTTLTPGQHTVEMGMFATAANNGEFRASFDDIKISRTIPTPASHSHDLDFGDTIDGQGITLTDPATGMITCPDGHVMTGLTTGFFGGSISLTPKCTPLSISDVLTMAVGGMMIQVNAIAVLAAGIGVDPMVTGLLLVTVVGISVQVAWILHKKRKIE